MTAALRMAVFFVIVLGVDLLAVVLQWHCPPLPMFFGARVLVFPVILTFGALALPTAAALTVAFCNGLLWDALTIPFVKPGTDFTQGVPAVAEFPIGWSILLFGVLTLITHGLRPLFLRGRWELHCLASGFTASIILLTEYLVISFHRGGLSWDNFPRELWWRIILPGFFAMLLAPIVYIIFRLIAAAIGYPVRVYPEKKARL